jgi:hypothetical protein
MIKDLLPIGSVIMLKNAKKALMIYGVKQKDAEDNAKDEEYDYIGVLYPEGNIGPEFQYLFNHIDIEEILFKGYESDEQKAFLEELSEIYGEK